LVDLESNLGSDLSDLETYIELRMDQLEAYLLIINTTLHHHLTQIEDDLSIMSYEVMGELDILSIFLDGLWQNKTDEQMEVLSSIQDTRDLMVTLDADSRSEILSGLTEIRAYLISMNDTQYNTKIEIIDSLISKYNELNSSIEGHLTQIEQSLVILSKLDEIMTDVETVDENLEIAGDDIKDNKKTDQTLGIVLLILLMITIGLLGFLTYNIVIKPKQEEEVLSWDDKKRK
jgi:hypothetical protein